MNKIKIINKKQQKLLLHFQLNFLQQFLISLYCATIFFRYFYIQFILGNKIATVYDCFVHLSVLHSIICRNEREIYLAHFRFGRLDNSIGPSTKK
jgi:hypothetical protein